MDQNLINLLIGVVGAIVGWVLKVVWNAIQELQQDMKDIEKELHTEYVSKNDLQTALDEIKQIVQRNFDKLDNTAYK